MSKPDESKRCLIVVIGATGDLNKRKLLPALARLAERHYLDGSHILGVARSTEITDSQFRQMAREVVGKNVHEWCDSCVHYRSLQGNLGGEIRALEQQYQLPENRIFYLALPPQSFAPTIEMIGRLGLHESAGWTRIVIEKPFGRDVKSAVELNQL